MLQMLRLPPTTAMMIARPFAAASLVALHLYAGSARAAEDPAAILAKIDEATFGSQDVQMKMTMRVFDNEGAAPRTQQMEMLQKGEKRLIRFLAPAEMRGTVILIQDRENAFVYLPQFQKVRRIAPHNFASTAGGSDFTQEDLTAASMAANFKAEIVSEDADAWTLKLTPKATSEWTHQIAIVRKADHQVARMEYHKGDKLARVLESGDFKASGGRVRATRITMRNAVTGHYTEITLDDVKVNAGIPDDRFTERYMRMGR